MPARPTRTAPGGRRAAAAPARPRPKANPLREYVNKEATPYHKAFAQWLVKEVGYTPENRKDFLAAIRLAITTRNLFNQSDFIEEWRERTGETKRGPKPKTAAAPVRKRKPEPEEDDFDDETEEEDFDSEDSDDDFDDFDDDESDDEEDDADGDDWEDDEEEEEAPKPAPKPRAAAAKSSAQRTTRTSTRSTAAKAAPAKKAAPAGRKPKPPADDNDFVF